MEFGRCPWPENISWIRLSALYSTAFLVCPPIHVQSHWSQYHHISQYVRKDSKPTLCTLLKIVILSQQRCSVLLSPSHCLSPALLTVPSLLSSLYAVYILVFSSYGVQAGKEMNRPLEPSCEMLESIQLFIHSPIHQIIYSMSSLLLGLGIPEENKAGGGDNLCFVELIFHITINNNKFL